MGKLACNHCISERLVLVMQLSTDLKCPSDKSRTGLSTEGMHRKRCWTLGALKETRSSNKASWALSREILSTAHFRSSQHANQVSSKSLSRNSVAQSRVALATLTKVKGMVWSTIFRSGWEMTSHLLEFKRRPILFLTAITCWISAATTLRAS